MLEVADHEAVAGETGDGVVAVLEHRDPGPLPVPLGGRVDQDEVAIHLEKGWNAVLVKLVRGETPWGPTVVRVRVGDLHDGCEGAHVCTSRAHLVRPPGA